MSDADRHRSALLILVWKIVPLARSGNDLIGLGEIIDELSMFDESPEQFEAGINIGVDIGSRQKDENSEEGLFLGFRISQDGIEFDQTITSYGRDVGSDSRTEDFGYVGWNGRTGDEIDRWFEGVARMLSRDDCHIRVSRDHV